jgi:hypothetical protein
MFGNLTRGVLGTDGLRVDGGVIVNVTDARLSARTLRRMVPGQGAG